MNLDYINDTFSEEQFFEKVFKKGKSKDSVGVAKASVSNLKHYCKDVYSLELNQVLTELKDDLDKTRNPGRVLKFVHDFILWLEHDHPNIMWKRTPSNKKGSPLKKKSAKTISDYIPFVKKYLKLCYGIRINDDDWRDYITLPSKGEEEDIEAEPLDPQELRIILESSKPLKQTMYMFMKDTGFRILETVRIQKKDIDMSHDPPMVTLPKSKSKGKRAKREAYLTRETAPRVALLLKSLDDDDYPFSSSSSDIQARNNAERVWNKKVQKLGFTEKYSNGRLKKNMHSIRAFTATQIYEATKDTEYAHGYIGHSRYLPTYLRKSEKTRAKLFRRIEPNIAIFDNIVVVENPSDGLEEQKKEIEKLKQDLVWSKIELAEMIDNAIEDPQEFKKMINRLRDQKYQSMI